MTGLPRGESRWPAALAVGVAIALQASVAGRLVPGPRLLLPALEAVLVLALVVADPRRFTRESRDLRVLSLGVLGLVALVNAVTLAALVHRLLYGTSESGRQLLGAAAGVWLTNVVVFGLAYWEVDRGGPLARVGGRGGPDPPDLVFPQDGDPDHAPAGWRPVFVDYLFVSLTAATAFSPTDTMPYTTRAKLLLGVQSLVSLLTVGLVAARAVNVLQ